MKTILTIIFLAVTVIGSAQTQKCIDNYNAGVQANREGRYTTAYSLFKKAADDCGMNYAYIALGKMYYSGVGVEKNWCEALKYFNKANSLDSDASAMKAMITSDGINPCDGSRNSNAPLFGTWETKTNNSSSNNEAIAEEEKRIAKAKEDAIRKEEERFFEIKKMLPSEINEQISKLKSLEEGKIYRFRDIKKLTNSSIEMSYFAFYGDRYIVFTKPEPAVSLYLSKDRLELYNDIFNNDKVFKTNFQFSKNESEVFYNIGDGFEHISINNNFLSGYNKFGTAFNGGYRDLPDQITRVLWYYKSDNKIYVSNDIIGKSSTNYNPYIEVGKIKNYCDYSLIEDDYLMNNIKSLGALNKRSLNSFNYIGLSSVLSTTSIVMICPVKKLELTIEKRGLIFSEDISSKVRNLYKPTKISYHWGYQQQIYNENEEQSKHRNYLDLLSPTDKNIPIEEFNKLYEHYSEKDNEPQYYTSPNFTLPIKYFGKLPHLSDSLKIVILNC